jgi:HPt (histidine-containing phosphotransfer) domain-containing protein
MRGPSADAFEDGADPARVAKHEGPMSPVTLPTDATEWALEPFDGHPPSAARTRADALARFENDEAFYDRIVPLFRQAASEQAEALLEAATRGDVQALQHWAHTLKGSLLTVGASATAERAEEIERAAREGRLDGLAARVKRLVAEAAIVVAHLTPAHRG